VGQVAVVEEEQVEEVEEVEGEAGWD